MVLFKLRYIVSILLQGRNYIEANASCRKFQNQTLVSISNCVHRECLARSKFCSPSYLALDFLGSMFPIYLSFVHRLPFFILLVLHSFCNLVILLLTRSKPEATDLTMWITFLLYHRYWSFGVVPRNLSLTLNLYIFLWDQNIVKKLLKQNCIFRLRKDLGNTQKAWFCIICSVASWAFSGSKSLQNFFDSFRSAKQVCQYF